MTSEQATELREHLIKELISNGFGDIVNEVNTRLEEDYEEKEFERNPRSLLIFFLSESMNVLNNLSSDNYTGLVNRLNENITSENKIKSITVELLNEGNSVFFDLKELPSYENIVLNLQVILNEISREN